MTADQLKAVMPYAGQRIDQYLPHLIAAMAEFGIDTKARQAAFIAQIAHESAQLSAVSENLNYSVGALMATWGYRFKTADAALPYARNPKKLANHVYADRMGNGNEASGDGFRFRGAGLIQLTGKDNQTKCGKHFGIPVERISEWLRTPEGACRSAAWFWRINNLNALADKGDLRSITKRINGGLIGYTDRMSLYGKAQEAFA